MDAAIRAYEFTLDAKYYNMAVDLAGGDTVAQQPEGWFKFTGGEAPNWENNVLYEHGMRRFLDTAL